MPFICYLLNLQVLCNSTSSFTFVCFVFKVTNKPSGLGHMYVTSVYLLTVVCAWLVTKIKYLNPESWKNIHLTLYTVYIEEENPIYCNEVTNYLGHHAMAHGWTRPMAHLRSCFVYMLHASFLTRDRYERQQFFFLFPWELLWSILSAVLPVVGKKM